MTGSRGLSIAALFVVATACGATTSDPFAPNGKTTVVVSKGEYGNEPAAAGSADAKPPEVKDDSVTPATALDPKPTIVIGQPQSLASASTGEGPLPLPTTIGATKGAVFVFGRTRAAYVVRTRSTKWTDKSAAYSAPVIVASAFDDDATPTTASDGDGVWFAVSSKSGGNSRVVRIDEKGKILHAAPRDDGTVGVAAKLGRIAALVPLKAHVAIVGRDGTAITFARMLRNGTFVDSTAKILAQGSPESPRSRAPRAVNDDDRVLVAFDGYELPGALESPGTTAEERAAPKPGIYIQRFDPSGAPASPLRRLTRPGFEAHALDVVVELGACAILGATDDGYEMFRFVRKTTDLGPYGGGLHLADKSATVDISLGTDAVGTLAVTSNKLLRIGPGVKIVPIDLPFKPPAGGSGNFDEIRLAPDGSTTHAMLGTTSPYGSLPTVARIEAEKMGAPLPTPWMGPPPQRLVFAGTSGSEGLALVVDAGKLHAVRFGANGAPTSDAIVAWDLAKLDELAWPKAPLPRAVIASGEWLLSLRDGRVIVASGAFAGKVVPLGKPPSAPAGGAVALTADPGKKLARAFYVPPAERLAELYTATLDGGAGGVAEPWVAVAGSERHFGALGAARWAALPRAGGGLYLLTSSGPKVTLAAQLFGLLVVGKDGVLLPRELDAPFPVQDLALAPSTGGPVLLASFTGKGVVAKWLDLGGGFRESFAFNPFRARGDGPVIGGTTGSGLLLPSGALPIELGGQVAALVGDRCPFTLANGPRSVLFACEEGTGDTPLAARAVTRVVTF